MSVNGDSRSGVDPLQHDVQIVNPDRNVFLRVAEDERSFWGTDLNNVDLPWINSKNSKSVEDYTNQKLATFERTVDILVYYGGLAPKRMDQNYSDKRSFEMINLEEGAQLLAHHNMKNAGDVTFGGIKLNRPYYITRGTESETNWLHEFNPLTTDTKQKEFKQHIFDECAGLWDGDSKFYAIGGCESEGHPYYHYGATSAWCWDVNTYLTYPLEELTTPRRCPTAVYMKETGTIMIIGGLLRPKHVQGGSEDITHDTVEIWYPDTNKWGYSPSINVGKSSAAALEEDGFVYLTGGKNATGPSSDCEIKGAHPQDPWETMAPLNKARYGHSMTMLNGDMIVLGGVDDTGFVYEIEKFDWMEEKWDIIGHLSQGRYKGIAGSVKAWVTRAGSGDKEGKKTHAETIANLRSMPPNNGITDKELDSMF